MPGKSPYALALVTAPNLKVARKLAMTALKSKLAACVNIVPRIESHYWWEGKLEQGRELLLIFKTSRAKVSLLERAILKAHPYDTAEFLVLPIAHGSERYLQWIATSLERG